MKNRAGFLKLLQALQPFTQSGLLKGPEAQLIATEYYSGDKSLLECFLSKLVNDSQEWTAPLVENIKKIVHGGI